jgi:mannose-6-phosphate isomerase-like protein (cupin superfamily)
MDQLTDKARLKNPAFISYPLEHGVLADMKDDSFPSTLRAWSYDSLNLPGGATHFGYVFKGYPTLQVGPHQYLLSPGMYFSLPGAAVVHGAGQGIVASRRGYAGFFQIGGPVEDVGRLNYIDGCTDSLLIPPIMMGDPCLNLLFFPPRIDQTQHTHPSMRVGIVTRGRGRCVTPDREIPLVPGGAFIIPTDGLHSFHTEESSMTVIAYHPDSDFGPTHETHPMINRTMVNGVSASKIAEIQTR